MSESVTIVFTDGACSGNPGKGGWAAIIASPEGMVEELGGGERQTTNNRMELTGALAALEHLAGTKHPIQLHTDSQYVIQGITGWVFGWKKNGWKTAEGKDVLNRDIWENLAVATGRLKVKWIHVPGHSGIPANERCDQIAQGFATDQEPELYSGSRKAYIVDLRIPDNLAEKAAWRSQKKKKGVGYYLSHIQGETRRHATWAECEARVKGEPGAKFKKCASAAEEADVLKTWRVKPPRD